jgi:hypothetical protein
MWGVSGGLSRHPVHWWESGLEGSSPWWKPLNRGSQIWTQETKYTGETFLVIEGEGGVLSRECMWSGGWVLGNSALDVLVSTKGVWGSLICP